MSMPADTPAAVITSPSMTTRSVLTTAPYSARVSRAAQCVVADRHFVHDQLRGAVDAVDFPDAVTVVAHVRAAVFRAVADFVQGEGLEDAQTDVVLDQLA